MIGLAVISCPVKMPDLVSGEEQQAVAVNERTVERAADGAKQLRLAGEGALQVPGRRRCRFRRRRADIDQDQIDGLRKRFVERDLLLPPRQLGRQQIVDVGVDCEVTGGVNRRRGG